MEEKTLVVDTHDHRLAFIRFIARIYSEFCRCSFHLHIILINAFYRIGLSVNYFAVKAART